MNGPYPGLDMSPAYEDVIVRLHDLNYKLRIQGRHEEADDVMIAIDHVKRAHETSKQ